jgi:Ca-activated chloride channel family protein
VTRADDGWMAQGQGEIDKLQEELTKAPASRRKLEALVRGLLGKGRFSEALPAARRFVELDPDLPLAIELLSFAAVIAADGPLAIATVDAMCEAAPESTRAHLRAAKAFEAAGGGEARACAHWRSLADLDPKNDDWHRESLRCRARTLGETAPVLDELRAITKRSKRLDDLLKSLEAGTLPTYAPDAEPPGAIEVTLTCEGGPNECPVPVVITPLGTVYSPWTPGDARASSRGVAFSRVTSGTYRVLLVGGAPSARGKVEVRALDGRLEVPFTRGGTQTVAFAQVRM